MAIVLRETKMKYCPKCRVEKRLSEFNKKRRAKDGLQYWCRRCQSSEASKGVSRKSQQRYRQTGKGKVVGQKKSQKHRQLNPEKTKAINAINHAITAGKLTRPSVCESCFNERFTEGHHEDYSKPLDVDWLCKECHIDLHRKVLV